VLIGDEILPENSFFGKDLWEEIFPLRQKPQGGISLPVSSGSLENIG